MEEGVRCGRGKYKEVEGRLVEEGMLDVEEVNMKKLKGGWMKEVLLGVEEVNMKKLKGGWWKKVC